MLRGTSGPQKSRMSRMASSILARQSLVYCFRSVDMAYHRDGIKLAKSVRESAKELMGPLEEALLHEWEEGDDPVDPTLTMGGSFFAVGLQMAQCDGLSEDEVGLMEDVLEVFED